MGRLLFALVVGMTATLPARAADPPPDFSREVRPILSRYCFRCHGPDDKARKAKLRLDDRAAAVEHGALVPGNADSELVRRIFLDADDRMPPPATKLALTTAQKDILKRWVASGAKYDDHWSFTPVRRPPAPE